MSKEEPEDPFKIIQKMRKPRKPLEETKAKEEGTKE